MPIPTFNIPYIEAHSTSIEFMTQINEKMKGREQRYPVWTYPKRTFSLKFEKNKAGREALEAFFVDVMGKGGNFNFSWEDKTYLCNFDSDSLQQNLKEQGFGTTELKLVAIDDTSTTQVDELDFYHKAECDGSIEFSTLIDKIFTAQNNRKSYWDAPKRSWTLSFEKNKTVRKELEAFFMAKRGRFRSFDWQWRRGTRTPDARRSPRSIHCNRCLHGQGDRCAQGESAVVAAPRSQNDSRPFGILS